MDIRDRIRQVIEQNPEMSVRSVSLKAGLSDSMLHKFLNNSTKSLTLETVDKVAEALAVDPRWLAYGEGSAEQATEVSNILNRISEEKRAQALRVLRALAEDEKLSA